MQINCLVSIWWGTLVIKGLRNFRELITHNKKMSNYELETELYRTVFWAELSSEYKNSASLSEFKTKIKKWNGVGICPCRLCKDYQPNIGYVWYDMNIQTIFIVLYETFLVFTNAAIDRYFFSIGFHDFRGIMTKSEKHQHDFILKTFWWLILCWFILFFALTNYQPVLPAI